MPALRLFIAVDLDDSLRGALARLPRHVHLRGFKLVPAGQLHLTLRFLGNIDEEQLPAVEAALRAVGARHAPVAVDVRCGGTFGNPHHPRVVWAGVDDAAGGLRGLVDDLEGELERAGFGRADRPWHPHLTLGRAKGDADLDRTRLESLPSLGRLAVDAMVLFRSTTASSGAEHQALLRVPLTGEGTGDGTGACLGGPVRASVRQ